MAYAAYRELMGANISTLRSNLRPKCFVLDVTVPSLDAYLVRTALAGCRDTGIVRCIPRLHDQMVRLEIQLTEDMAEEVMHRVMVCVQGAEIGHLTSWENHLLRHGLSHGQ